MRRKRSHFEIQDPGHHLLHVVPEDTRRRPPRSASKRTRSKNGCPQGGSIEIETPKRSNSDEEEAIDPHRLHLHLRRRHQELRLIERRSRLPDESTVENAPVHLRHGTMNEKKSLLPDEKPAESVLGHLRHAVLMTEKRYKFTNVAHPEKETSIGAAMIAKTLILIST